MGPRYLTTPESGDAAFCVFRITMRTPISSMFSVTLCFCGDGSDGVRLVGLFCLMLGSALDKVSPRLL